MAPGATTHGFDTNQRYVDLKVLDTIDGQGVDVAAPPSANVAPPGYYMLFLINKDGVPSVADWVKIDPPRPISRRSAPRPRATSMATAIPTSPSVRRARTWGRRATPAPST